MNIDFKELDYQETELGPLSLRRRGIVSLGGMTVYEIQLGDAFLMSSMFTTVETALAELALRELEGSQLDVIVGGLGLGYTARAALRNPAVKSLVVIEALPAVIGWHQRGLLPLGPELTADPRCRLVQGDFFAQVNSDALDAQNPGKRFHAILLDIDHSPRSLLHRRHQSFYEIAGLRGLARHLHPGGIFGMWSDDAPDDEFMTRLDQAFADCRAHIVKFHNPLTDCDFASTVYVARAALTK